MNFISNSSQETEQAGKNLSAKLKGGDILLLSGELGAGKTSLVKGLANGLGIKNEITSPTFTLMNVYEVRSPNQHPMSFPPKAGIQTIRLDTGFPIKLGMTNVKQFVHIDTYRLKDEKELVEIGVEDYLGKLDTVCAIEWPEKISSILKNISSPHKIIAIHLKHGVKNNQREVLISEK